MLNFSDLISIKLECKHSFFLPHSTFEKQIIQRYLLSQNTAQMKTCHFYKRLRQNPEDEPLVLGNTLKGWRLTEFLSWEFNISFWEDKQEGPCSVSVFSWASVSDTINSVLHPVHSLSCINTSLGASHLRWSHNNLLNLWVPNHVPSFSPSPHSSFHPNPREHLTQKPNTLNTNMAVQVENSMPGPICQVRWNTVWSYLHTTCNWFVWNKSGSHLYTSVVSLRYQLHTYKHSKNTESKTLRYHTFWMRDSGSVSLKVCHVLLGKQSRTTPKATPWTKPIISRDIILCCKPHRSF